MTDITSKDNKYYSLAQYNGTNSNVLAETDDVLLYPIIENASDYQVAISKARIDLSGIPLTENNIPLKTYQVGLRNGNDEYTAYVRQLNASDSNYLYNVSASGTYSKYLYSTASGTATQITLPTSIPISSYLTNVFQFVETDFQNVFVVGSTDTSQNYNTLVGFSSAGSVIYQNVFPSIQAMCLDRQSNLYLAIESGTGSVVEVYQLVETTNPIGFNLIQTISLDANGAPLSQIQTMCAEAELIVGSQTNTITIYDTISWNAITTYTESAITQLGTSSAILSAYDRFCVEDRGGLSDLLIGVPAGTNAMEEVIGGSTFVSGAWLSTANQALWAGSGASGFALGIGTDNNTYAYTYDGQTGATTAPVLANSTTAMKSCFKASQLNTVYGLVAGTTGALVAFNLSQQQPQDSSWSIIDRVMFPVSSQAPISADTQINTQKLVMVGTDNNLYQTSTPYAPKTFYNFKNLGTPPLNDFSISVNQEGVGWNIAGTITASTVVQNNFNLYSSTAIVPVPKGFAKSGNNGWLLIQRNNVSGGGFNELIIQPYSLPTFTDSSLAFNISSIFNQSASSNVFDMCYTVTGNFLSVCYSAVGVTTTVYNYNATTGTLISTINVPHTATVSSVITSADVGGTQYLVVVSDTNIYTYNMNTPASPVLLGTTSFTGSGGQGTLIGGVAWVETTLGNYLAVTIDNAGGGVSGVNQLYALLLDGSYQVASSFLIDTKQYVSSTAAGNTIGINNNINGVEISVLGGTFNPTEVYLYNCFDSQNWALVSQFQNTQSLCEFVHYCPDTDYTYAITPITQGGTAIQVASIAFSQNNPNLLFALNTAGTVYSGDLAGGSITFTVYSPASGSGAFDSINAILPATSTFDTYVRNYGISGQNPHGDYHYAVTPVYSLARNAISGEFLVSSGGTSPAVASYEPLSFAQQWSISNITGNYLIYAKNGEDINAGSYDIYDFQTLIDAINVAFQEAFVRVPSGIFATAPVVSLNFQTGLATLTYSADYSGTPLTRGILMNSALHQLLYYYSTVDTVNPNFYKVALPLNSTSLTQTSKSLYLFNQLDKILFISNTIFVFGSYFGANNTNNIITDIDVPTNSDGYMNNLGQVVYYQPTFLRPFILNSNIPLSRVQMQVWYSTLNGEQRQLEIVPDGNWNAKLLFCRRY